MNSENIFVVCNNDSYLRQAQIFSTENKIPFFTGRNNEYALQLCFDDNAIELFDTELNASINVDFISGAMAHREKFGGGKGQSIAKAIGLNKFKNPAVIDVTAGLARDAYILATLGCDVTLIEQSPVLFALIKDGIERALASSQEHSVKHFTDLVNANSMSYLQHSDTEKKPDVIYMDPMFPERKKSALVKKDMQILHKLIGEAEDEAELLTTALSYATKRVVVKRPIHAPVIAGHKPSMDISSKKTRYDVYVTC